MSVLVHLALEEWRLSMQIQPEDEAFFARLGPLEATFIDGVLVLAPGPDGNSLMSINPDKNAGRTRTFWWGGVSARKAHSTRYLADLPRFQCHEVELRGEDDFLTWDPPPGHRLPWSRRIELRAGTQVDWPEVARRELTARIRAARPFNEEQLVTQGAPAWVKRELGSNWMKVVNEACGAGPTEETVTCT